MVNATGYMIYHQETNPLGPSGGDLVKSIRGTPQQSSEELASTGANHGFIIRNFIGYLRPDGPVIIDSVSKMMKNFRNGPDKNWNKNIMEKFFVTVVGLASPAQQILQQHLKIKSDLSNDEEQKVIFPNSIYFSNANNKKVSVNQQTLCDDFLTNPMIYDYLSLESLYNEGFNYDTNKRHMTDPRTHFMYKGVFELFKNNKETVSIQERFSNVNPLRSKTSLPKGKTTTRSIPSWEGNKMLLPIRRHKLGLNSPNGFSFRDSRDIASLFRLDVNPFVDLFISDKRNIDRSFAEIFRDYTKLASIDNLCFNTMPKMLFGNISNSLIPPHLREQMAVTFLNKFSRIICNENRDMLKIWENSLNIEKIEVPFIFILQMFYLTHSYKSMDKLIMDKEKFSNMINIANYYYKNYKIVLGCTNLAVLHLYSQHTSLAYGDLSRVARSMLQYVEEIANMHIQLLDAVISNFNLQNGMEMDDRERRKNYLKYGAEIGWVLDFSKPNLVPMTFVADNICGKIFTLSDKNSVHTLMSINETDPSKRAEYLLNNETDSCRKWVKVEQVNAIFNHNTAEQVV